MILNGTTLDDLAVAYALTMHWWIYLVQAMSAVFFLITWRIDLERLAKGIRGIGQTS